jgi:putative restriction endonuclease
MLHDATSLEDTPQSASANEDAPDGRQIPDKRQLTITRIVRGTKVGEWVKRLYDFTCQICGRRLLTKAGAYAETCHVKPLGRPHNGPDSSENILCLALQRFIGNDGRNRRR